MNDTKEFDLIIWGASGFTGRLVAEYIFQKYGVGKTINWAMGGRNQAKLEIVRAAVADETVPLVIADSQDEASLEEMVKRTKVICSTVGPYAKYGSKLVAACVNNQVDYCDLTGEAQWIRRMIDAHHDAAKANGTKIVHTCGFDSIPSDLGVFFMQKEAQKRTGKPAKSIKMRVRGLSGGLSGGTFASMENVMEEIAKDKSVYKVLTNPYSLNPEGEQSGPDKKDLQTVLYEEETKGWLAPFVMAGINTKVVRRSNALMNYAYGKDFRYDEAMMFKSRFKAIGVAMTLGIVFLGKPGSFYKKIINRFLPDPGEGPSKAEREAGFYKFHLYTTLSDDSKVLGIVTGDKDPGYGSTCKMLAESAICLAQDELSDISGVLTPSTAMSDKLLKRLEENAGLTFSIV
jgi:short subunit dehydrogenase-like uncharacterized protein